jgi:hypothetical protein
MRIKKLREQNKKLYRVNVSSKIDDRTIYNIYDYDQHISEKATNHI